MTLLYQHITKTLTRLLQPSSELQRVNKWCEHNHVEITISKTKLMYVTSKPTHRQLSNTHSLLSVQLLDSVVDASSSERLLGVTINNDLSWNTHIENSFKKCITFLYLLSRIKVFLSFQNRKQFYNAYIIPHFDLCCAIWGNCTSVMEDNLVKKKSC